MAETYEVIGRAFVCSVVYDWCNRILWNVCKSATRLHDATIQNTKIFTVTYARTSQPACLPYKLDCNSLIYVSPLIGTTNNPIPHPITILSQVSCHNPHLCTLQTALCGVPYPVRRRTETINTWQKLHVALPVGRRYAVMQFSTYWESHLRLSGWFFERHNCITGDGPKFLCFLTMLPEIHVSCTLTLKILFLFCNAQYYFIWVNLVLWLYELGF